MLSNYLAEMLDIGVDETMAVGDSENDLDMLLRCGHPVVVANAMDSLKKVAKMFVSSNEEDGGRRGNREVHIASVLDM